MDYSLNSNEWQNLIYLLLLITVMLMGLFSRRNLQYSKIFKYLAIWGLIGFVVVALYSYRYEFSDFTSRIAGGLNPSAPKVGKNGEIVINASNDGHFYITINVNGEPMRFMIDTGASEIVLNGEQAKRAGISLEDLNFNRIYQTANGNTFGASVTLAEIEVGGKKFYEVPASVNQSEMGVSLLGMTFLRQFKRYEFYRDKLILEL